MPPTDMPPTDMPPTDRRPAQQLEPRQPEAQQPEAHRTPGEESIMSFAGEVTEGLAGPVAGEVTTQGAAEPRDTPDGERTGTSQPQRSRLRVAARWLPTFFGFPLGGLTASLVSGPVDGFTAALLGGAISGAILGAAQAWGMGRLRPVAAHRWIIATAVGFMVGLAAGAAAVDYGTSFGDLVVQGAVSGLAVGAAQGVLLRASLGRLALAWPPALAALWALGWAVTTAAGIDVDEQFTVFGSSGALVVTAATVVLPVLLAGRRADRGPDSAAESGAGRVDP
jgi:hypothetical protein